MTAEIILILLLILLLLLCLYLNLGADAGQKLMLLILMRKFDLKRVFILDWRLYLICLATRFLLTNTNAAAAAGSIC